MAVMATSAAWKRMWKFAVFVLLMKISSHNISASTKGAIGLDSLTFDKVSLFAHLKYNKHPI